MIQVAVGIIFRNNGKEILLCQRRPGLPYPHKWEFPGGKVNDGEQIDECLKRELREELDITIRACDLYHRQSFSYSSGTFDIFYYLIQDFQGIPFNHAFHEIRWVSVNELPRYDILEGNASVVKKLLIEYGKI